MGYISVNNKMCTFLIMGLMIVSTLSVTPLVTSEDTKNTLVASPETSIDSISPDPHDGNISSEQVTILATVSSSTFDTVMAAECRIDGGTAYAMVCVDGAWDSPVEQVEYIYDFPNGFSEGVHTVEVHGYDEINGWNISWTSDTFTVTDTTEPKVGWQSVPSGPPTYCQTSSTIRFLSYYEDFTAYDMNISNSYFKYRVNNGSWTQDAWFNESFVWGSYSNILSYTFPGGMFANGDIVDYLGVVSDTAANGPYTSTLPAGSIWFPYVEANMNITKWGPSTANPGGTITYRINYTNLGTLFGWHDAENVMITDTYPAGVTFVSAVPPPSSGNNIWDIGSVPAEGGGTITVTVSVDMDAFGTLTNWAYLDYENGYGVSRPQESDFAITSLASSFVISLHHGWNLISFPLIPTDTSVGNLLSSISGNWDIVKCYNSQDTADPWKTHRVGAYTNDLTDIDNTMGFWLHVTNSTDDLIIYGNEPVTTNIILKAGWNQVSHPSNSTDTMANALWGTGADRVECYNAGVPYLIKEMGSGEMMIPGNGYWVRVLADSVWTVDY